MRELETSGGRVAPNAFRAAYRDQIAGLILSTAHATVPGGDYFLKPTPRTALEAFLAKPNFLNTAREGGIACVATRVHDSMTTQVWDAQVTDGANDKTIALFRCTQLILYPGPR